MWLELQLKSSKPRKLRLFNLLLSTSVWAFLQSAGKTNKKKTTSGKKNILFYPREAALWLQSFLIPRLVEKLISKEQMSKSMAVRFDVAGILKHNTREILVHMKSFSKVFFFLRGKNICERSLAAACQQGAAQRLWTPFGSSFISAGRLFSGIKTRPF